MKVFWRVIGYLKPYWFSQVVAYLCMLALSAVALLLPKITQTVIDKGILVGDMVVIGQQVLYLVMLTALRGVFRFGQGYLSEGVAQTVAYDMRNAMYRKLEELSFSYHDQAQSGELLSRATSDVERVRRLTGGGVLGLFNSAVMLVGTVVILIQMQPLLAVLSLLVMPLIVWIMNNHVGFQMPFWRIRQQTMARVTARVGQNLTGVSVVRGFAQEDAEIARFDSEINYLYDTSMRLARRGSRTMPLIILLASASTVVILLLGGRMVIQGALTLGALVAFNSYVLQLVGPMRRIGFLINLIGESQASAERVFEVLDTHSAVSDKPGARELGEIQGSVSFDDVTFSYFPGSPVLQQVSFDVKPGQVVALLGPTGSGKSTITNLIARFYDVDSGSVRVDGTDVRDVTLDSLRSQIGMVLQETLLFGSTIKENIAFGRTDATDEEIEAAARAAAAHDFIMRFPDGYDTEVGERGSTLSGGQRQRVAIARALLLNPRILILDDATSSVDTETEQQIQGALKRLMQGRTSFVIAQRVSTVREADLILVIDKGRLVAEGKHQDLIRESGIYADIYYRQLRQEDLAEVEATAGRGA
ncbi:MAG: ABC transporter ATP-binding protein [Anaerolineae bacterium]|jgi:ABC-type multidrug transport system fused ATPase/permease subunit|nr:ABC transporter ATP-binding protein [Chloroflexota bacterium]